MKKEIEKNTASKAKQPSYVGPQLYNPVPMSSTHIGYKLNVGNVTNGATMITGAGGTLKNVDCSMGSCFLIERKPEKDNVRHSTPPKPSNFFIEATAKDKHAINAIKMLIDQTWPKKHDKTNISLRQQMLDSLKPYEGRSLTKADHEKLAEIKSQVEEVASYDIEALEANDVNLG